MASIKPRSEWSIVFRHLEDISGGGFAAFGIDELLGRRAVDDDLVSRRVSIIYGVGAVGDWRAGHDLDRLAGSEVPWKRHLRGLAGD